MPRISSIVSLAVSCGFTCLCVSGTIAAQTDKPVSPPSVAPAKPAAAVDPTPVITLLDAGTGDKSPLRYAMVKGQETELSATSNIAITQSMGGNNMPPQKLPTMTARMKTVIADVTAEGEAMVAVTFTDAQSTNPVSGTTKLSNRGVADAMEIDIPADASPAQRMQMEDARHNAVQYFVPFPEEPIAPGAKWKVEQSLTQQGMTIQQTITYTFTGREGDAVVLAIAIEQTAAEQDIQSPQMPGMKIHLNSFKTTGTGEAKVDLACPLSKTTKADIVTDLTMTIPQVGEVKQHMAVVMSGTATIKPAAAAAASSE